MSCTLTQRVLHVTETGNIQGFQVTTATALQYHPLYFFQQAYASDGKHRTPMTGLALYPPHNHIACYALSSKTPPMLKYNALTVPLTPTDWWAAHPAFIALLHCGRKASKLTISNYILVSFSEEKRRGDVILKDARIGIFVVCLILIHGFLPQKPRQSSKQIIPVNTGEKTGIKNIVKEPLFKLMQLLPLH